MAKLSKFAIPKSPARLSAGGSDSSDHDGESLCIITSILSLNAVVDEPLPAQLCFVPEPHRPQPCRRPAAAGPQAEKDLFGVNTNEGNVWKGAVKNNAKAVDVSTHLCLL